MKPELVDLEEIFKENTTIFLSKKPEILKKNIDYGFSYKSLFNFIGLIFLLIGLYFLNKRKKEKDERKKIFEEKIYKLKDIIKNNNEFIL